MEDTTNLSFQPSQNDDNEANETELWTSIIGGGALVLIGLQQRSLKGILMALAGSGLMYQGVAKKSTLKQAQEALGLEQTIKVEKENS